MKAKQETSDPGQNHSNNSKNGGEFDFTGQDPYDVPGDSEAVGVPVRKKSSSNPFNGSGGSKRTIAPGKVKGSNP